MSRPSLVRGFAARSLVAFVLLAVALGWTVRAAVEGLVLRQWADARGASWAGCALAELGGADVVHPLDEQVEAGMSSAFEEEFAPSGVLEIKLFDPNGVLAYSSAGETLGVECGQDAGVAGALAGRITAEIADEDGTPESAGAVGRLGRVVEVYIPMRREPGRPPIGVLEVYHSYVPVAEDIRSTTGLLWGVMALGLAVLYAIQVGVVKRAEVRLAETEAEVDEVNARLGGSMRDLEEYSVGTLQALISAVDAKDSYTARHSLGVTDYAVTVGRGLGLSEEEMYALERACLLHDVGKIGVSERILLKPARLNPEETGACQEHSEMGARIVGSIPFLRELVPVIRHHHERWDGGGYPGGLAGPAIPRLARIIAVADAFDAMTSDRPYRPALRVAQAREELVRCSGTQFDSEIVEAFVAALDSGEISPELYHPGHIDETMGTRQS